ncbi:MAG: HigA family addiction module antidote protein [Chthoniobacterales bacterium]|nr:HigA family addiction module antidote protein [Chthoniobacterales bacterium]
MPKKNLLSLTTPGEILNEEFLTPMQITEYALAKSISVPPGRINEIVKGNRAITPDTALRLSLFFGTTAQFWINLQTDYELLKLQRKQTIPKINPYRLPAESSLVAF